MYICVISTEVSFGLRADNISIQEMIELTCILLKEEEDRIEHIDIFHKYVKPQIVPNITKECSQLTGITQEMLDKDGISFTESLDVYHQWICKYVIDPNLLMIVTNNNKMISRILPNMAIYHEVALPSYFRNYCTIKSLFQVIYGKPNILFIPDMLFYLEMPLYGRYEKCIDECRDIARIIERMYNDGLGGKVKTKITKHIEYSRENERDHNVHRLK
jgi:inhibitor of KinA sporulation pathway (predicted exonuclease)